MSKYQPDKHGVYYIGRNANGTPWYCLSLHETCFPCQAKNVPVFNGIGFNDICEHKGDDKEIMELLLQKGGYYCYSCQVQLNNNGLQPVLIEFLKTILDEDPSIGLEM